MSQSELADLLFISESTISRWLSNRSVPAEHHLVALREILGEEAIPVSIRPQLYVSSPVDSLNAGRLDEHQHAVQSIVDGLRDLNLSVHWPGEHLSSGAVFQLPDLAAEQNLPLLESCETFVLLLFDESERASSALIELGIALGLSKRVVIVHGKGVRLPFMLEGFGTVAAHVDYLPVVRLISVTSSDEALQLLKVNAAGLLLGSPT